MKNVSNLKTFWFFCAMLTLSFGFMACSDDDDDGTVDLEPTGVITVADDEHTLSNNTITIQNVTVGQDSWLAAVMPGDEDTDDFIADPVMISEGSHDGVQLIFDENAITDDGNGQQVVLKLYADNPDEGIFGEWDPFDEPIFDDNDVLETETITVFAEDSGTATFADFDSNDNGMLDPDEVPATYQNNFDEWDADDNGSLSSEEFYNTTFMVTDADDNDSIDEDEWNLGYDSWFGDYLEDDFATFDANSDDVLSDAEWDDAFADSDWFETYDANNDDLLEDTEWDTGLFNDWDLDGNNSINEEEYNSYIDFVSIW